jgi:hypothetical protein
MDAAHLPSQGLPAQTAPGKSPPPNLSVVRPDRVGLGARAGVASERADLSPPGRAVWLGRVHLLSVAGLSAFVVAIVALHGLRADLDPAEHTISEYSLGSYGWLMRAAFSALGVGALATGASFCLGDGPSGRWRHVGPLLLAGTAVGSFLDAGFNTDHLGVPETVDGSVHSVGTAMLVLALPVAAFVFGSHFIRNSTSTLKARLLPILAAAQLGAIVLFEMSPLTLRGWAERLVTVLVVATLGLLQVLSRTGELAGPPREAAQRSSTGTLSSVSPQLRHAPMPHGATQP